MFENTKTITVSGGGFPIEAYPRGLNIDIMQHRLNLIYGKNGCGKSTIASAIASFCGQKSDSGLSISFASAIEDTAKSHIHVFNEAFIEDNLLVKSKGPSNITMLGSGNIDLDRQIQKLEEKISDDEKELTKLNKAIAEHADKKIKESEAAAKDALTNTLKNNGFTDRSVRLKNTDGGQQGNIRITDDVLSKVINAQSSPVAASLPKDISTLKKIFEEKVTFLKSAAGSGSKIIWSKTVVNAGFSIETINELLSRTVIRPELTEREQKIFALLGDADRTDYLHRTSRHIVNANAEFCPLCHQSIDGEHRSTLADTVSRLLGEESGRLSTELDETIAAMSDIDPALPAFPDGMYSDHINNLRIALAALNTTIREVREALESRRLDLYAKSSCTFDEVKFNHSIDEVNEALEKLSDDVDAYNKAIDDKKQVQKTAEASNILIAYLESKTFIDKYAEAQKAHSDAVSKKEQLVGLIHEEKKTAAELKMQINNTKTACEYINAQMKNIFFHENRLSLIGAEGGEYVLHSRGKAVPPKKVSTGERNIIALTYFFAGLFKDKPAENKYSEPMLVIIDDPVSSFDYGNRTGIMAFLQTEIKKILDGNSASKVVVLSHDLYTIWALCNPNRQYCQTIDNYGKGHATYYELTEGHLSPFSYRDDNEYWKLMQDTFKFANQERIHDRDTGIGNEMRRLLETYSTFMFQCGFKDILSDDSLYEGIPEGKKDYYRNFVGRLILDAQSHAGNQVNRLDFVANPFSENEKRKTAQGILTFLYHTNALHLKSYLNNGQFESVRVWAETQ